MQLDFLEMLLLLLLLLLPKVEELDARKKIVGQRWPCVLRGAALDSVSRVKEVLGSIPPATATEIK